MRKSPIENVIFDLDGTLVDSVQGVEFALNQAIRQEISSPPLQSIEIRKRMGPPILQIIQELLPDIPAETGLRISQQFRMIYNQEGWKKSLLYDTVLETLAGLVTEKVKVFVVTNKPVVPTQKILEHTGVMPYLTDHFSPDFDGTASHPKSNLLNILLGKHHLRSYNTYMVGDSIGDAQSAQTCGLGFMLAAYGYGEISDFDGMPIMNTLHKPVDLLKTLSKRE